MNKKFINQYLPIALCGLLMAGAGFTWVFLSGKNSPAPKPNTADNYIVKGQSYGQVINQDPSQKLEIKISDAQKPEPSFELKKWDGEAALKITPDFHNKEEDLKKALTQSGNKFIYKNGQKEELHMYSLPKNTLNPEGGYEVEWVLNEKPLANVFNFNVETTGLEYYFQPPLTEEQRPGEVCSETQCHKDGKTTRTRPENVIGSYAVYAKGKKDNYKDLGGKNYGTGKVGHIYRPKAIDFSGREQWSELKYENGVLSVTVPKEFLDKATYPVIVDPTFGYTTAGASTDTSTFAQNSYVQAQSNPSSNGTLTTITTYGAGNGADLRMDCALYSNKAGPLPDARLAFNDFGPTIDTTLGWDDCPISYSGLTAGTQYWLAYQEYFIGYDSGSGAQRYDLSDGPVDWPAVADDTNTFAAILSIYGTYTSAAPITVKGGFKVLGGSSGGGSETPAFVQSASASDETTDQVAFGSVTSGNVIAVAGVWQPTTIALNTITAPCVSGGFTLVNNPTLDSTIGSEAAMAYGVVTSTGACTITLNFSGTDTAVGILAHEISGINTSSPFDGSAMQEQFNVADVDAFTSGSIVTTTNGDYIFGVGFDINVNDDLTPGSGFTGRITSQTTGRGDTEDRIQTSAGSIEAKWTASTVFRAMTAGIMAFKPGSSAGTPGNVKFR